LAEHLQRMARSAAYFGIDFSHSAALAAISCAAEQHAQTASEATYRLRLVLDGSGEFSAQLEDAPLTSADVQKVALVPWQVYSKDPALAHKTTQRHVYAQARAAVVVAHGQATEPLLVNERGEVTETDIANVVFSLAGRLYTPPCSSGLLPGILREVLLQAGELQERVLLVEHLAEVEALYLINDLRGWRTAQLTNLQPTS
jgi:para-aminobenzoate synthetase/4-amino-4-deoxychorismate lyase